MMAMADDLVAIDILERREKVRQQTLRGYSQYEIAKSLGASRATICQDLKWLEQQALEVSQQGAEKWKAVLNDRNTELFFRALRAWDASERKHEGQGDPRYLQQARQACEELAKLNGAYEPFQTQLIDENGKSVLSRLIPSMGLEELDVLDRMLQREDAIRKELREASRLAIDVESKPVNPGGNGKSKGNGKPSNGDGN